MSKKELGKIRQSNIIMNYGPGAIIDFRAPGSGAAVSVVAGGLEYWEQAAEEAGAVASDMKRLTEPRLAQKLHVSHFRLPPVSPDTPSDKDTVIPLTGKRFPGWLQCPKCHIIQPARRWGQSPGDPSRYCSGCSSKSESNENVYVVPVRFVTACRHGHLEDFPWSRWVHSGSPCSNGKKFKLEAEGPGLAGLVLSCGKCGKRKSLEFIFSPEAHKDHACSGARPWLIDGDEVCEQKSVTLQRGASNIYFPLMQSALVIPPWSEEIIRQLGYRWNDIATIKGDETHSAKENRERHIDQFWEQISEDIGNIEKASFKELVEEKIAESEKCSSGNLRWDEYQQFRLAASRRQRAGDEFEVRSCSLPSTLPHLNSLLRVVSLREIRALQGFTRIEPMPGSSGQAPIRSQYLSQRPMGWLPAIEVRGEGIFISLCPERLSAWESRPEVKARASALKNYKESRVLNPDNDSSCEVSPELGARFLLIHSLAHILMKQLALQCGYSSASLRERLYLGSNDQDMAGVMIYTATSDSDGTLGGLQRQGLPDRFGPMFLEAIRANEWCSSDPLCIKGLVAATESATLAACHSCLLAPETSCEDFNRFLDRAMLVGTPEDRSIGFFSDLTTGGTR
ncbi:DrmB family protein [Microbulbifer sp. SA54]|uniref:DrmB family protein n=1 Tax=Microbulbifer sp. SA54 TaxID=3401577 RepID=UPI003AAC5A68